MRLTPAAVADDGWLDLLAIDPLTFSGALSRLPRLFDGRLAGDPAFHVTRCRDATIASEPPSRVQLDGQSFGTTPVTVSILPGALNALDCRPATREAAGSQRNCARILSSLPEPGQSRSKDTAFSADSDVPCCAWKSRRVVSTWMSPVTYSFFIARSCT